MKFNIFKMFTLITLFLTALGCLSTEVNQKPVEIIEQGKAQEGPILSELVTEQDLKHVDDSGSLIFDTVTIAKIRLNFLNAPEIINLMRPFLSDGASMAVLDESKSILVIEKNDNIAKIRKLITLLDSEVPTTKGVCIEGVSKDTVVEVIKVRQNRDPNEIMHVIKALFSNKAFCQIVYRSNSILLVGKPKDIEVIKAVLTLIA